MKYKLIKEYPGSGPIDTEVAWITDKYYDITRPIDQRTYPKSHVETSPDFWQKIIEKEWTVLSFTNGVSIANINSVGDYRIDAKYSTKLGTPLKWMLSEESDWLIHSVKREKDGEIFTVGDIVDFTMSRNVKITSFEYEKDNILVRAAGTCDFFAAIKKRKSIFTTEDGVEIFHGDEYFKLTDFEIIPSIAHENQANIPSHKFSSKEKAQYYIDMYKPKYSLNDIVNAVYGEGININVKYLLDKLKEL